jgi:hypothetical protein
LLAAIDTTDVRGTAVFMIEWRWLDVEARIYDRALTPMRGWISRCLKDWAGKWPRLRCHQGLLTEMKAMTEAYEIRRAISPHHDVARAGLSSFRSEAERGTH